MAAGNFFIEPIVFSVKASKNAWKSIFFKNFHFQILEKNGFSSIFRRFYKKNYRFYEKITRGQKVLKLFKKILFLLWKLLNQLLDDKSEWVLQKKLIFKQNRISGVHVIVSGKTNFFQALFCKRLKIKLFFIFYKYDI